MDNEDQQHADWLRHGLNTGGVDNLRTTFGNIFEGDLLYMGTAQARQHHGAPAFLPPGDVKPHCLQVAAQQAMAMPVPAPHASCMPFHQQPVQQAQLPLLQRSRRG